MGLIGSSSLPIRREREREKKKERLFSKLMARMS
jgi:hypothetical protein